MYKTSESEEIVICDDGSCLKRSWYIGTAFNFKHHGCGFNFPFSKTGWCIENRVPWQQVLALSCSIPYTAEKADSTLLYVKYKIKLKNKGDTP